MFRSVDESQTLVLDEQGHGTILDYSFLVNDQYAHLPVTVTQTPPPNTVLSDPQAVFVRLEGLDQLGNRQIRRFRVDALDQTPPTPTVTLTSTVPQRVAPAGHAYFVAPATITVSPSAQDACDPDVSIRMWCNGVETTGNHAATAVGTYAISLQATDASGNVAMMSEYFEIRAHPDYVVNVWVDAFDWGTAGGLVTTATGQIKLTGDFEIRSLAPTTLRFWLVQDNGIWSPLPGDATLSSTYSNGTYTVVFAAAPMDSVPANSVVGLGVTGIGGSGPSEYDFIGVTDASPDGGEFTFPIIDPNPPQPPPSPIPCRWVVNEPPKPMQSCVWANYSPWSFNVFGMWVTTKSIRGDGSVDIDCCSEPMSVNGWCSKTNGTTITVQLVGDDCNCNCNIHVVAAPALTAVVNINPTADAQLEAHISVTVGGVPPPNSTYAGGSVSLSGAGGLITVWGGIPIPIPAGSKAAPLNCVATPAPLNLSIPSCLASITIQTGASLNLHAETAYFDWHGSASGRFGTATPGLTITPTDNCNAPPIEPIIIDFPPLP